MELSIDSIPYVSMAMAQSKVMSDVGTAMLSKTLDVASVDAANLTKAMELSVNPELGANFDIAV